MRIVWDQELYHYGVPRRSGRYKWGSGKDPYHHGSDRKIAKYNRKIERKEKGISKRDAKIQKINTKLNRPLNARALRKQAKFEMKAGKRAKAHNKYERKYVNKGKEPMALNISGQIKKHKYQKYNQLKSKAGKYSAKTEKLRSKKVMLTTKNDRANYKISVYKKKIGKIEKKDIQKGRKMLEKAKKKNSRK